MEPLNVKQKQEIRLMISEFIYDMSREMTNFLIDKCENSFYNRCSNPKDYDKYKEIIEKDRPYLCSNCKLEDDWGPITISSEVYVTESDEEEKILELY